MVGYEFESQPVEHWLTKSPGGDLWWVSSEYPDSRIGPIESARNVIHILGPSANPKEFFGQLSLMLLRLPVLESMTNPFKEYAYSESYNVDNAPISSPSFSPESTSIGSSFNDEELESEYLRGQLRRCQEVLYSLEQAAVAGEKNAQLQAQIEYQKHQIADLEDQFRSLSSNRPRVVELMEQITQSVQQTGSDPDTMFFIQNQVNTVKQEYSKVQPNQHIVSASIGATVVVGERLGGEIVKPELVSELASFAPSVIATRGI